VDLSYFRRQLEFESMPLLELDEEQLEWIIACCRLHANDSEFQRYIIHLLESNLPAVCFRGLLLHGFY
jgi:hypothetical protein